MSILNYWKKLIFKDSKISSSGCYPSTLDTLENLFGKQLLNDIYLNIPDRRQITEEVARRRSLHEDALIKQIAEQLNLAVFFRPKPIDVDLLPCGVLLSDLRSHGIIPMIAKDIVIGVICTDPAALNVIRQLYSGRNIYLSSWKAILTALNQSESLYLAKKRLILEKEKDRQADIFKNILAKLLKQANEVKASTIYLLSDCDSLSYSFKDQTGRDWIGSIESQIAPMLSIYLENSIAEGLNSIIIPILDSDPISIKVTAEHGRILIKLSEQADFFSSKQLKGDSENKVAKIISLPSSNSSNELICNINIPKLFDFKVLLLDDNSTFAEVLSRFFSKHNISIESCLSTEEALTYLRSDNTTVPDLIIVDVHLSGSSGLDFIKIIKKDAYLSRIPVIALSSDETPAIQISLLEAGIDAFVTKNQDSRILSLHAKRLIALRRAA